MKAPSKSLDELMQSIPGMPCDYTGSKKSWLAIGKARRAVEEVAYARVVQILSEQTPPTWKNPQQKIWLLQYVGCLLQDFHPVPPEWQEKIIVAASNLGPEWLKTIKDIILTNGAGEFNSKEFAPKDTSG